MIEDFANAVVTTIAWLLFSAMLAARVKVECELGWNVANVKPSGDITCIEKIKVACCGEPAGIVCEKPCPVSRQKYTRIYCTNGTKPIWRDEKTVGCTR